MATDIWKYSRVYDWGRYYFDICSRTQFSKVTIKGRENIPTGGHIIYAPNHVAAMMDPLVTLLVNGHGPVGFGARSDIFSSPVAAWALHFVRILPLARERNGLKEVAKNFETFDDIVSCLRHGMPFCMYAEGTHRPERGLLPLKKGIFRIARKASEELDGPVYVVPISSDYEYFYKPMGRIAITVGEPINVGEFFDAHKDEPEANIYRELVQILTDRIKENLDVLPERRHDRKAIRLALAVMLIPVWAVCAIVSTPIWLVSKLVISTMEDKAFSHTVYFAVRLFFPLLWPFYSIFAYLSNLFENLCSDLLGK